MKTILQITTALLLIILLLLTLSGSSSRDATPIKSSDSTITYSPKILGDLSAKITLFKKENEETGNLIGAGTIFTIKENARVQALVNLENLKTSNNRDLMFHLKWIGPNNNSLFTKRVNLTPDNLLSSLKSSISISPDKRQPGFYKYQLYFYRELIAEKRFNLIAIGDKSVIDFTQAAVDSISAKITLCRKINKKTGKLIGKGTTFTIDKKAKVNAVVHLENRNAFHDSDLMFDIKWIGPGSKSFYKKHIEMSTDDSSSTIKSSISIPPERREPGLYSVQLYLFDELIAEKGFELQAATEKVTVDIQQALVDNLSANITLYRKVSKKTGKMIGKGNVFTLKDKAKVRANVELVNIEKVKNQDLVFYLDWSGPNGKSFYKKQVDISKEDSTTTIKSSIKIPPDRRNPGSYNLRIYLFDSLIAEKSFELNSDSTNTK
jgi:phosphopantetheine adenylyltransferase